MGNSLPLKNVAIVGCGYLGSQIAMMAVFAGYEVKIFDSQEGAFRLNVDRIRLDLQDKAIESVIPWEQWDACAKAVQQVAEMGEATKEAELIVESVPENLELKQEVFREIGEKAPPDSILATNSSSLPISRLESSSGRPKYCLNLHFYYPLEGMNMVDIMRGTQTLPEVVEKGIAWIYSLGAIPLVVKKERLGFCFNRIWRAVKKDVLHAWADGFVDFKDVDRAWMIFMGVKKGPFGVMDKAGLDVIYDVEMVYYRDSKDPQDYPPDALKKKIKRGELGVKSGKGFYTYPNPEYLSDDFLKPCRQQTEN